MLIKAASSGVARQAALPWHGAHSDAGHVDDQGSIPSIEGLDGLSPEQAVIKLQRHNTALQRKAQAAMALEQENALLQSQLDSMTEREVGRQLPTNMRNPPARSTVPPGHTGGVVELPGLA